MRKNSIIFCLFMAISISADMYGQCATYSVAVSDVTLQCSNGTSNRSGVAFYPTKSTYYSVNAGSSGYPIETFSVSGSASLSSTTQATDYRGLWYNPNLGIIEGNAFSNGGIYQHNINPSNGYAVGTSSNLAPSTMPNSQSCGAYDPVNNQVLYYNATTLYKYNRNTGALVTSMAITGLPATSINSYGILYTGIAGKEVGIYDYTNKAVYFLDYSTGAYVSTCQLPATAPTPGSFKMSYTNNRIFLYDGINSWIGYKLTNQSDLYFSGNNLSCSGTPVTVSVSGATTYTWSTGSNSMSISVNPTTTTIYSVAATNSLGCTNSSNFVVSVGISPTITANASNTLVCGSGSATLTASGAGSYTWNTGSTTASINVTPSVTTVYSVTSTGTLGCSALATTTITVENNPTVTVSGNSTVCSSGSASLTASGAATYTWSNGSNSASLVVTPSVTSNYTVMGLSPGGCAGSNSTMTLNVVVNPNPTITASSSSSLICAGQSVTLTAGGANSYSWTTGGTTSTIAVSPTITSSYVVTGTNTLNCKSTATITQNVSACTGIVSAGLTAAEIQVYPNPGNGLFNIRLQSLSPDTGIEVYNIFGQSVIKMPLTELNASIDLTQSATGIYFIVLTEKNKTLSVTKLIKQ